MGHSAAPLPGSQEGASRREGCLASEAYPLDAGATGVGTTSADAARDPADLPAAAAAAALGSDLATGLSSAEVAPRLARHGRNEVPEEPPHPLRKLLSRFWGPSAWMIELVAVVSALLHRVADVGLAAGLLVANALLGFAQERRAGAAVEALRSRLRVRARVLRDGAWSDAPATEVVPGDVLRLRAGDFVPADAKVAAGEVSVDPSALTGESQEVARGPDSVIFSGSLVRRGEATALVLRTGAATFYGRTTSLVQGARPRLHVEEVVGRVVRWLFVITGALTAGALAVSVARGLPVLDVLPLLLLLLLSAVPVALPVMFTVSMAVGAAELSRRGVLVTRLSAAEDAATMDVLCADKTGTITRNQVAVVAVHAEPGFDDAEVIRLGARASEEADEDPIDRAFLAEARRRGIAAETAPRVAFQPFSAATRRTEATFAGPEGTWRAVKGALATVAAECQPGDGTMRRLEGLVSAEAARGRRAIAVAAARPGEGLSLAGLAILEDPPRPDSAELIRELRGLGVGVKVLTGDALSVACEVARQVGLGPLEAAGRLRDATAAAPAAAASLAERSDGFAEVFPEDKFQVVRALQEAGHVVGMTGDGVNDAPALRQAEVGIAVRTSADVAKASASVVLTTEGLTGIVELVRNGRVVYQRVLTWIVNKVSRTIEKSAYVTIAFLVTGRFVVSTFGMILLLFLTDFVKISLATDRVQGSRHPETWRIGPWVGIAVVLGLLMVAENLALLALGWRWLGLAGNLQAAQTFSFQALLFFGLFSILSVRERDHFWRSAPSPVLALALGGAALAGVLLPLADLPGLRRIPAGPTATAVVAAAVASLLVNDLVKTVLVRRAGLAPGR
jgi:plasma-membrane proton-efflux P-type ATPase